MPVSTGCALPGKKKKHLRAAIDRMSAEGIADPAQLPAPCEHRVPRGAKKAER